ncbi:MAG: SCO family protein [Candidatus Eisenbacteria bacterium]|uniref:SCO family protein n=1 Tax=Eiseniibacteriota bacterium TaxID=2212470 RepID=A0A7Y2E5N8_UNCEI|nr:SCO family protein [Candidatus Eisenbacteria bacterium]
MKPILTLAFLGILTLAGLLFAWSKINQPDILPVLGTAPSFTLTQADGSTFSSDELAGDVWLADFFFTSCGSICPTLTARMSELEDTFEGLNGWKLISISVDPENDTPEVLSEYAREHDANPENWIFLTGEKDEVHELVRKGFLQPVEEVTNQPEPILHTSRIVLVDREGRFRGFYDALDPESVVELTLDSVRLIENREP